jgi:hypothetical protein
VTITAKSGSEAREDLLRIFGTDTLPILSPEPSTALGDRGHVVPVFLVPLDALSEGQIRRAVAHLALKFRRPVAAVRGDVEEWGCFPLFLSDAVIKVEESTDEEESPWIEIG